MKVHRLGIALLLVATMVSAEEPEKAEEEKKKIKIEEVMVVTASRTEQFVHDAPAAISVITAQDLEQIPADDYGDVLRNVAGLNTTQISARDIQVTGRQATSSLATSQLVLVDGRTLYLDFFGFVMWDLLPISVSEVKQIEIVRGPGSAVWGANAMTGVINVITKRPTEMQGTKVVLGAGDRSTLLGNVIHAGQRDRWSYKLSVGSSKQDPFDRPTGLIPETQTPYPSFENEGTKQTKADLRLDYDLSESSYVSVAGGYAGTDGLVHTGIGPFDIESGSSLTYVKADWSRGALRANVFANFLDFNATNLLTIGLDGRPISFSFTSDTWNADVSNTSVVRKRNILTYGATARKSNFDLSIAPLGKHRTEYGGFVQDEILFGRARWVVGTRWDHIDPIGSVISPRTAFLFSPTPNHTLRLSFGRAYRAPSLINHYLDTAILSPIRLPTGPFFFPTRAMGNIELDEERLDAFEVGYAGTLPRNLIVGVNLYRNRTKDATDFYSASFYTSANPPPGWPLPASFLDAPPLRNALPSSFSYRNIGEIVNKGVEISLQQRPSARWSWFANYSWQDDPHAKGISPGEINRPPTHRANLGASWDRGRYFINSNINYQSDAFWTDVLDPRFWGPTESFTSVNTAVGMRLRGDRTTLSLTATNLLNDDIQQHVFGDILSRKVTAQLQFRF